MNEIKVYTWNGKESLTLREDCLVLYWMKTERVIPLSQVISFDVKDPKSEMRPGMITIRLAGSSGTSIRLTSFLSTGNSNNVEFPHAYEYLRHAHKMQEYISSYKSAPPVQVQQPSAADEIKKYKELLDIGAISEEEYSAKKRQLLGL